MDRRFELPQSHLRAWYSYAFAAEVYAAIALAIFLPITLEQMAHDNGYLAPDLQIRCSDLPAEDIVGRVCKLHVLGIWLDSASFSMYVKSISVAVQALCIISIGPLADSAYWRKRVLIMAAYTGSFSSLLFFLFPSTPYVIAPIFAAMLTILGNASYATSIVCANAFLPGLAQEDPEVRLARRKSDGTVSAHGDEGDNNDGSTPTIEHERSSLDEAGRLLPDALVPALMATSPRDIANRETSPPASQNPTAQYAALLSLTTSRISSIGVALGFFSGVSLLILLIIPISLMGGTTAAMRIAIGVSAAWWAVFTIPALLGLPGGPRAKYEGKERGSRLSWAGQGWKRVGRMITPKEVKRLPNLFTFLFAWIFLSDGFHTVTYTAILYASSTLRMGPSKIILIGVLVQLSAVISSVLAPRIQSRLQLSNLQYLIWTVIAGEVLPIYTCIGLILPFGGLRTEGEMYVAATWFGLLYGPFNSYSRAVYAELIPPGHESSFFSLFSLTDKSSSFIGPAVVGIIADLTGNIRLGFIFLLIMLAIPLPVLLRVRVEDGVDEARRWTSVRDVDHI